MMALHYFGTVGTIFAFEVFTCQAVWAWWKSKER